MIKVEVVLFATLQKYNSEGESSQSFYLEMSDDSTVEDLLKILKIPARESKQVFINSRRQEWNYNLQDGDRAAIFPPIAGG